MIKKITIKNVASYDDEGIVIDNLQRVNFIYGGNGTGKTTLSRCINTYHPNHEYEVHSEVVWDGEEVEVLAYNSDFKQQNLQADIAGVFTIGEEFIQLEKELAPMRKVRLARAKKVAKAYKLLNDADDAIKAEESRLQDALWERLYLPHKNLLECLKGYEGKVSFTEKLKSMFKKHVPSHLTFKNAEEICHFYKELYSEESSKPNDSGSSTLKIERENMAVDVWTFLSEKAKGEIKKHQMIMKDLQKKLERRQEEHKAASESLYQADDNIRTAELMLTSLQPAIDKINKTLEGNGFNNFKIQPSPTKHDRYQIQRADGSYVNNSLSEGEQTFITFLYYMQLASGMDKNTNMDTRRVLVIDDPISSLDSDVMQIVNMMLRKLINEVLEGKSNIEQVIVLTHNKEFYRLLSQRKKNDQVHYYKLMKDDGVSRVLSCGIDNPMKSDYAMQWEELRMLKAGHSVPNAQTAMRKIVDAYFVRLGGYGKYELIEKYFSDNAEERITAMTLLKLMDEGSHGVSDESYVGDMEEVNRRYLKVFKRLFEKTGHLAHYEMMMREHQDE